MYDTAYMQFYILLIFLLNYSISAFTNGQPDMLCTKVNMIKQSRGGQPFKKKSGSAIVHY